MPQILHAYVIDVVHFKVADVLKDFLPPLTSEYWLPIFCERRLLSVSSQLNLLRSEFSPELIRPISCPGLSHTALSCQGWSQESSCCYQRPGVQMPLL